MDIFQILTKHKGNLIQWARLQPDYTGSKHKLETGQYLMTKLVIEHDKPELLKAYEEIFKIQKKYNIITDKVRKR